VKTSTCWGAPVAGHAAQHADLVGLALGDEEVAVGRRADEARVRQLVGVELDLEAGGRLRPGRRGRSITFAPLSTDGLACGGGKSRARKWCQAPARSL